MDKFAGAAFMRPFEAAQYPRNVGARFMEPARSEVYRQNVGAKLASPLIRMYQLTRIFRPSYCRFYPSCSDYCLQAIDQHGLITGIVLTIKRLLKCHPFHSGGVDFNGLIASAPTTRALVKAYHVVEVDDNRPANTGGGQ